MERNIADRFSQEVRALGEEGRQFSAEYPEAGNLLDLDNVPDRDPYVERLIESFAFLSSRVREAMDSVDDGLDRVLLDLVADDLEEPLPAIMVSECIPRRTLAGSVRLSEGMRFQSGAIRQPIRWSLLSDHDVHPLVLRSAGIASGQAGESFLVWELDWFAPSPPPAWPSFLRFFLHGDASFAWTLRYALLRKLLRVEMLQGDGGWRPLEGVTVKSSELPGLALRKESSHPFSQLRDFLCADERERFLDVTGLAAIPGSSSLVLRFVLAGQLPRPLARAVQASSFRFHAALAVNRFEDAHCTFHCDHARSEYPLRPEGAGELEILDILTVEGIEQAPEPSRVQYVRHGSFRQKAGDGRFFRARREIDASGRTSHFLSVGHDDPAMPFRDSFLSVQVRCCDGNRPHEAGSVRDLRAKGLPIGVGLSPLTRPGPRLVPPAQVSSRVRLLVLAAAHFQGAMDAKRLRELLFQLLWDPQEAKRPLVEAISEVSSRAGFELVLGVAFPLQTIRLRMRDTTCAIDTWERLGLIDAFGKALFGLFDGQAPLGYRFRLELEVEPCGVVLEFGQRR